jgi:hypothetical protein
MSFVMVLAATLSIAGCANLFTGNMFANFDGPPSASDLAGRYADADGNVSSSDADSFVGDVEDAAGSSRFFDDLSDNDRTTLTGSLKSVYDNDSGEVDDATRQRAAVLAADVTLRGADSGETINNVANVLTSAEGADSFSSPQDLMDQIIPDSAKDDPVAIKKILDDMVAAADAYDALGGSLTDDDGDGEIDNAPEGTNMAEVAQKAAVAMVVRNLAGQDSGDKDLAQRIADNDFEGTTFSDPLGGENSDGSALNNILKAGGLGGFFDSDEE